MSRSRRKTPITAVTSSGFNGSDKPGKRAANRALRVAERSWLASGIDAPPPLLREVSNVYGFPKDGKLWRGDRYPELNRK
ncbi:hypothetical protein [Halotalea alkalilenta]|uniref:hypothetical protein n=1 Tax=Halotalea alkalilenta TaxID=376489 RepID=UPI0012DCFB8A|nr:hypothetical protein [Halotalea alkalilenta]